MEPAGGRAMNRRRRRHAEPLRHYHARIVAEAFGILLVLWAFVSAWSVALPPEVHP